MTLFLGPAGLIAFGRRGSFERQTEGYVDVLVSPEDEGSSRNEKSLTRWELQGCLDRVAAYADVVICLTCLGAATVRLPGTGAVCSTPIARSGGLDPAPVDGAPFVRRPGRHTHLLGKLVERERLRKQVRAGVEHAVMDHGVARVTRGVEHPHARHPHKRELGELPPGHPRHHDVGERQGRKSARRFSNRRSGPSPGHPPDIQPPADRHGLRARKGKAGRGRKRRSHQEGIRLRGNCNACARRPSGHRRECLFVSCNQTRATMVTSPRLTTIRGRRGHPGGHPPRNLRRRRVREANPVSRLARSP